jgi:hypothetical protein
VNHTIEAIGRLNAAIRLASSRITLPEIAATTAMIATFSGAGAPREPADPEALRRRLLQAAGAGRLEDLSPRECRDAAWLLWNGRPNGVEIRGVLDAVLKSANENSRTLRVLIEAWLRDFDPGKPGIAEAGRHIARRLRSNTDLRLAAWRRASEELALFDAVRGPGKMASHLLYADDLNEALRSLGFDNQLRAASNYMRAVHLALLDDAPGLLRSRASQAALARIIEITGPGNALRFADQRGPLASALLKAWVDGGQLPGEPIRQQVQAFLLRHLHDPRIEPQNWTAAGEDATRVMRGWLARASLDTFFDIIREEAKNDATAWRQWRYRESFWRAYLECGAIGDAWVALGSRVSWLARASADLKGAYGRLEGANSSGHAVLLMRIGPLTLAEYNHNGRLRAWPADWKTAPPLYKPQYTRDELFRECLPFPSHPDGRGGDDSGNGLAHFNPEKDYWQISAAELIRRRAGVSLEPADWRPK